MSFPSPCPACQRGEHEQHDPDHGVIPGIIGGTHCTCRGDCDLPDWGPTAIVLRQLEATFGETPGDWLPKGAVVDSLNQIADRLLMGEVKPREMRDDDPTPEAIRRAETAEARLRAVEALADEWDARYGRSVDERLTGRDRGVAAALFMAADQLRRAMREAPPQRG